MIFKIINLETYYIYMKHMGLQTQEDFLKMYFFTGFLRVQTDVKHK